MRNLVKFGVVCLVIHNFDMGKHKNVISDVCLKTYGARNYNSNIVPMPK